MTDSNNKIRALVLTALMVFSVFAGTVAFTGTAAAVQDVNNVSISPTTVDEDTTVTHRVQFTATNVNNTSTHTINISLPDGVTFEQNGNSGLVNATFTVNGSSASPVSGVSNANGGQNMVIDLDTSGNDQGDVTVDANVSVVFPNVDSEVTAPVGITFTDAGDGGTASAQTSDITIQNTDASDGLDDTNFDNGGIVFVGQTASYDAIDADDDFDAGGYQLFERVDSDTGSPVRSLSTDNGSVNATTSGLEAGTTYFISNNGQDPNDSDATFTVREQDFSAEFADDSVDNTGDTGVELEVASTNRQSTYNVTVESEDLDDDDLVGIFSNFDAYDADTSEEDGVEIEVTDGDQTSDANFSEISGAEYNFTFSVTDTDAEADASVTVNDVGEGELDLANSTTTVTQGGVAVITVEMSDAATSGTIVIGDESEDGYQASVDVTDDNDDGQVTVAFNTYRAGNSGLGDPVALTGDSDEGEDSLTYNNDQTNLSSSLLDSGDYIVSVSTSSNATDTLDSPDNVGTLVLTEPEAPDQLLWRTSQNTLDDVESAASDDDEDAASAIVTAVENDQVTQTDTLAVDPDESNSDVLVHQLTAPSIAGALGNSAEAGDVTTEFATAVQENNTFNDSNLNVVFEEQDPGANQDPATLDLADALNRNTGIANALTVISDGEGTYYVFVNYDSIPDAAVQDGPFEDGDDVDADISVQDDRLLDIDDDVDDEEDEYQTTSANFSVEESEGDFDLNEDDLVQTTATEDAQVTGTTNVAPGTEFTVRVQSDGNTEPRFFETQTVTVQADGSFNASFDLSDQAEDDEFTASVRQAAFSLSEDGVIAASQETETPGTTDVTDTTETPGTTDVTETTETTEMTEMTEMTEETDTETSTPGFGAVLAVIALLGAALLAARRQE